MTFVVFSVSAIALSIGITTNSPAEVYSGLFHNTDITPIITLRLNRLLLAGIAGASLALSGAIYQSLFRNPLGDPFLIGISGGAALGASIAIILSWGSELVMITALIGSLGITLVITFFSTFKKLPIQTQILVGVAINTICSSLVMLIHAFSDTSKVHNAMIWLMGDISGASPTMILPMALTLGTIIPVTLMYHRHLDIIAMDDTFSHNLGVTKIHYLTLFWLAAILASFSVAVTGIIGFIGLMSPHITRQFTGGKHLVLIPGTILIGSTMLITSDSLARSLLPPFEIPVGIITGLAGGVFFIILVAKR